ncbi:hypothetical protein Tco_0711573 [Tanacetum coccineum]
MASIFGSKSKSFMTMSILPQSEPSICRLVVSFVTKTQESWALLEDLALYDNESWNDPRDFAKSVKTNSLPQDVSSTSDRHLIELEDQVQRLMEAHHASKSSVQVNKIASSCEKVDYAISPNKIDMDDLESKDKLIDTPLVLPFLDSDDKSDDGEVIDESEEYGNAGNFYPSYKTIMVEGLESTGENLVANVRNIYVFVGSLTYITNFVVLEDIGEFIVSHVEDVVMGRPFRTMSQCPENQIDENMKEWLTRGHVIFDEKNPEVLRSFMRITLR